jgi:hypothetical protein
MQNTMNKSEVARVREEIELQLEAMRRGMYGFASGTARHAFVRARMDRIGEYQQKLTGFIGEQDADQMICSLYSEIVG